MENNATDQAMATLQRQWYNAIVNGLSLDPNTFQLYQTDQPLSNTSKGIWDIFNSIPPLSLTHSFDSGEINNFFDDYKAVVNNLLPPANDDFEAAMGDNLAAWNKYRENHVDDLISKGYLAVFTQWAEVFLEPDQSARVIGIYKQSLNNPINLAIDAVNSDTYIDPNNGPKFSKTIADLRNLIIHGESKSFDLDSQTASSDTSHTWTHGRVSGILKFFYGGGQGDFDKLNTKASNSHITITGSFQKVVPFTAAPDGWFSSAALGIAYQTKDNTVWRAGRKPDWVGTFGANGNLLRYATQLIVVDGIDYTITSNAKFDSTEQQTIRANGSIGFWPFFSSHAAHGSDRRITFSDSGEMTVHSSSPAGNPVILGVNVLPINNLFS